MDAIPEATAALRSGRAYEIRPLEHGDGWVVAHNAEQPAIVIDLAERAWTAAGMWTWAVTKERLAWRLVLRSAEQHEKEVLRVAPRGEMVKYRMAAGGSLVCKLRQNLLTRRWRLYNGTEVFARVEVSHLYFRDGALGRPAQSAGRLELGSRLPNEPIRSACLICALLCIRFDAGYANGSGPAGP